MIWDFIRDFFVQYIFGGMTSTGDSYSGYIGFGNLFMNNQPYQGDLLSNTDIHVPLNFNWQYDGDIGTSFDLTMGDWLSTTATIIVMCLIIWLFLKITIYLFKAGAGLLKW